MINRPINKYNKSKREGKVSLVLPLKNRCDQKVLERRMREKADFAKKNPLRQEPLPIGLIGDFESKELLYPSNWCKIFISYGVVYSHSGENPPHTRAHTSIMKEIQKTFFSRFGKAIKFMTGSTIRAINENRCHALCGKISDGTIGVFNGSKNIEIPIIIFLQN